MHLLARLALSVSAVVIPAVASAQPHVTFAPSQPNAFNNGSYLVGPFNATFVNAGQSAGISIFCVDVLNTVSGGQTWNVNITSLANGANGALTRHPALLTQYREAAFVSSYFSSIPKGNAWTSMQYAMWGLLNPGSAPADPNGLVPTIVAIANTAAANDFGAFSYGGVSFAAFDYSRYSVLTHVGAAGVADDNLRQEFITGDELPGITATPEPATLALVGGGLLLTAGAARRRRAAVA